jgi:hypothetical protein
VWPAPSTRTDSQCGQGLRSVFGSAAIIFVYVTLIAALAAGTTIAWVRIAWRVAVKLDRREWASASWFGAEGAVTLSRDGSRRLRNDGHLASGASVHSAYGRFLAFTARTWADRQG